MKQKFVIQWHINNQCNLKCQHCYQDDYSKNLELDELIKIFNQILDFFNDNNYKGHINFTGGEPFLSKNIWKLMDLCEQNKITFGILTNGVLISQGFVDILSRYTMLKFVQISIDGDKSIHDSIRGEGNFNKAFNAVRLLKNRNIQTMISFTANKKNKDVLKDVIRICEKEKVDRFWTDRLIPMGNNKLDCMTTEEYKEFLKILGKESIRAQRLPWIKTTIHTNRAMQFICTENSCGYKCSAGINLLTILADGTLLPCRRLPLELGNLTTQNISEIVNTSTIIQELKNEPISDECQNCNMKNKCNSGAKCLTYAITGSWHGKDVNCWNN